MPAVDLDKCAADLKSRIYEGPEWLAIITDRVRSLCLQENGYFKAAVNTSTEQLHDKHGTHQFVVTFTIDSGPQYRMGEIGFRGNRVFSEQELRSMFNLASGDIFRITKIRQSLDQIRSAYIERRYLNFTSFPATTIDDSHHVISVLIDCDEGKESR